MILSSVFLVAQLSAGAIVARVKDTELRVQDLRATVNLEIVSGDQIKTRRFALALKREGVNYRALVTLEAPRAMVGTQFLIHAVRGKRNREWAYFPDLDLVRPISGKRQDDPFLSSDITYADLAGSAHLDDLRHELLGEEAVEGETCYVMEGTPRHRIAYGKLRGFIRKRDFVTVKAMFYDHEGALIKEAFQTDIREVADGARLAHRIEVRSAGSSSVTTVTLTDVAVNQGLDDTIFSEDAFGTR